jgi:hypothetical protein
MLKAMKLFDSTDELIKVIQEMDDDNSGATRRGRRGPLKFARYPAHFLSGPL